MQQCRLCRAVKTSSEELYKLMNSARALSLLGRAVEVDRPIFRPPAAIFVCCEEALQVRLSGTNRRITASVSRNNGPAKSPRICVILFQGTLNASASNHVQCPGLRKGSPLMSTLTFLCNQWSKGYLDISRLVDMGRIYFGTFLPTRGGRWRKIPAIRTNQNYYSMSGGHFCEAVSHPSHSIECASRVALGI